MPKLRSAPGTIGYFSSCACRHGKARAANSGSGEEVAAGKDAFGESAHVGWTTAGLLERSQIQGKARSGLCFWKSFQNLENLFLKLRKVLNDGIPDDFQINAKIIVDEDVAHRGDLAPGNGGVVLFEGWIDRTNCFADNH